MGKLIKLHNNYFWILILFILSLLIIDFSFILKLKNSHTKINLLHSELAILAENTLLKDSIAYQQMNFKILFEKNLKENSLELLLMNENKIFLLFDENSCSQCIVQNIMDFNILSEIIGTERIILAGDFSDHNSLEAFMSNLVYDDFKHILLRDIYDSAGLGINVPIVILIDTNYNITSLFFDYKENFFQRNLFFETAIKFLI
jgi:hypothetical protein